MKRLLLLLLAFVLPLQFSWAATHLCDDAKVASALVASAQGEGHEHFSVQAEPSADAAKSASADKPADPCCPAAHGCHGLHHLIGQACPESLAPTRHIVSASPADEPAADARASRVERPKWAAA